MFKKVLILMAIVLVFSACKVQAEVEVIDSNWVGDYGVWGDTNNWDPAIVPDNTESNTFVVIIKGDIHEPDIGLLQSRTINRLDCYGPNIIWLSSWKGLPIGSPISIRLTLLDANGLINHGDLSLGELDIRGNIRNAPEAMLELENIEIVGNLYNQPGGEIELKGHVIVDEGCIENSGAVIAGPGTKLWVYPDFYNSGQIRVYGAACSIEELFDNSRTGVIKGFGIVEAGQSIQNKGTICASAGFLLLCSEGSITNTGTLKNAVSATLHIQPSAEDTNNQGTIEVNAAGAIVFDCNMVNEPNGVIKLLGGTLAAGTIVQKAGARFEGFGGITGDVVIDPNGIIKLTGPTNIVGDVNIPAGATLEISDGTTLVTSDCACNNGTIHMKGGRIIIQGVFANNNCRIIWEPGTYTNIADFNLDGTVNFKDFADFADTWLWQASWY